MGKTSYQENVAAAVRAIREGKAEKIVMARPARFEFAGEAGAERARAAGGALASRLRERYPTCWIFNVGGLVGATPEMLLEAASGRAHSRVLAGTATPGEDVDLAHSAKNLAEHQVALRSVAEPLRRVDPDLETSGPYLLQLPNLTHLATVAPAGAGGQDAVAPGGTVSPHGCRVRVAAGVCADVHLPV